MLCYYVIFLVLMIIHSNISNVLFSSSTPKSLEGKLFLHPTS